MPLIKIVRCIKIFWQYYLCRNMNRPLQPTLPSLRWNTLNAANYVTKNPPLLCGLPTQPLASPTTAVFKPPRLITIANFPKVVDPRYSTAQTALLGYTLITIFWVATTCRRNDGFRHFAWTYIHPGMPPPLKLLPCSNLSIANMRHRKTQHNYELIAMPWVIVTTVASIAVGLMASQQFIL
jgi:hypothetical protein